MSTANRIKYTHYTSANKDERKNYCNSGQKEKSNYVLDTKTRLGEENEELQSVTTQQSLDMKPKTIEVYNDSSYETDSTVNMAENQRATQEDTILKTQSLVTDDITNVSEICMDDSKQTEEVSQSADKFVDSSDLKNCDHASGCGLLRYRKWWERIEVDISVYGKLITGVPIFIEDNTLRVVNNNYSYFIPLEKVDYIRTTDGLRPSFDSSDDKLDK